MGKIDSSQVFYLVRDLNGRWEIVAKQRNHQYKLTGNKGEWMTVIIRKQCNTYKYKFKRERERESRCIF